MPPLEFLKLSSALRAASCSPNAAIAELESREAATLLSEEDRSFSAYRPATVAEKRGAPALPPIVRSASAGPATLVGRQLVVEGDQEHRIGSTLSLLSAQHIQQDTVDHEPTANITVAVPSLRDIRERYYELKLESHRAETAAARKAALVEAKSLRTRLRAAKGWDALAVPGRLKAMARLEAGTEVEDSRSIGESRSVLSVSAFAGSEQELEPPAVLGLLQANKTSLGRLLVHFADDTPGRPPPAPSKARLSSAGWMRLCNECDVSPPLPKQLVARYYQAHATARNGRVGFSVLLELLAECAAARTADGAGQPYFAGTTALRRCKALLDAIGNSKAARAVAKAEGKGLFMTLSIADELEV
eukprot:SAG31_NODE_2860_length_4990_cov_2.244326_2_plen_360_part_00